MFFKRIYELNLVFFYYFSPCNRAIILKCAKYVKRKIYFKNKKVQKIINKYH